LAGAIWEQVLSEGVRRINDQTTLIICDHLLIKNNHQRSGGIYINECTMKALKALKLEIQSDFLVP